VPTDGGEQMSVDENAAQSTGIGVMESSRPRRPHRRRRQVLVLALVVALATLASSAGGYAVQYQPLQREGWSSSQGGMKTLSDGAADYTGFLVDPTPGTPARFSIQVENTGRFAVTLTGVDHEDYLGKDTIIGHWAAEDPTSQSLVVATSQLRNFPVTLRPGDEVAVMLSISKRIKCGDVGFLSLSTVALFSKALGVHHRTELPFPAPLYVCFPATGLHFGSPGGLTLGG
jgi:hypothetical protein